LTGRRHTAGAGLLAAHTSRGAVDDARRITGAIASGDGEAFARLYEDRFDFMYALVRRRTGLDGAACLDIVQEAMMKVVRGMKPLPDARLRLVDKFATLAGNGDEVPDEDR